MRLFIMIITEHALPYHDKWAQMEGQVIGCTHPAVLDACRRRQQGADNVRFTSC
jgi:hypothetical protein|eukprot:COSAG01_NODE_5466_length_4243_cov_77.924469_2_plen_54_part_00